MITSLLETIFKGRLYKIAKRKGLAILLEMLLEMGVELECGKL